MSRRFFHTTFDVGVSLKQKRKNPIYTIKFTLLIPHF